MALATRCPTCSTVFRISTAQAAAKGGMVRCGQCRAVFNSLDALVRVEDLDVIEEIDVGPPLAPELPDFPPVSADDAAATTDDVEPAGEAVADAAPEPVVETPAPAPRPMSEWWLPERTASKPAVEGEPTDQPAEPVEAPADAVGRIEPDALLSGRRTDLQWNPAPLESTHPTFMRPDAASPIAGRATRWVYGLLSLAAVVALLAQATYLWRDELAVRWSPAKTLLAAVCKPFRCRVDYPARAEAITIESASVQTSGPNLDVYVLTALLRNRDATDVRYPHLELVLTDLQDRPILRRALRPEDYLPSSRVTSGFAAESELPIRVMFELSGLRFAGYRLDRFYP